MYQERARETDLPVLEKEEKKKEIDLEKDTETTDFLVQENKRRWEEEEQKEVFPYKRRRLFVDDDDDEDEEGSGKLFIFKPHVVSTPTDQKEAE